MPKITGKEIPLFDGTNFSTWSVEFKAYMSILGLTRAVTFCNTKSFPIPLRSLPLLSDPFPTSPTPRFSSDPSPLLSDQLRHSFLSDPSPTFRRSDVPTFPTFPILLLFGSKSFPFVLLSVYITFHFVPCSDLLPISPDYLISSFPLFSIHGKVPTLASHALLPFLYSFCSPMTRPLGLLSCSTCSTVRSSAFRMVSAPLFQYISQYSVFCTLVENRIELSLPSEALRSVLRTSAPPLGCT